MKRTLRAAFALLVCAGIAHADPLPRPAVNIPASKVRVSGYTATDLQTALDTGEIASARTATDCTTQTGAVKNEICRDTDDNSLWQCSTATCEGAGWVSVGGGVGGSGDITAVGPGYSSGSAFTDGAVSTGTTMFIWEGTTSNSNELSIISPTADPSSDINITLPSATGTLVTSTDNIATATALAANGSNCTSSEAAIGVTAAGVSEGCWSPVAGPASSESSAIPTFNGTGGKTIQQPSAVGTGFAWQITGGQINELWHPIAYSQLNTPTIGWKNDIEGHKIKWGSVPGAFGLPGGLSTDDTFGFEFNHTAANTGITSIYMPAWVDAYEKQFGSSFTNGDTRMEKWWGYDRSAYSFTFTAGTGTFAQNDLVTIIDAGNNRIKMYGQVFSNSAGTLTIYGMGADTPTTTLASGDLIRNSYSTTGSSGSGTFNDATVAAIGPTNCASWTPTGGNPWTDATVTDFVRVLTGGSGSTPALTLMPVHGDMDNIVSGRCIWQYASNAKANLGSLTAAKTGTSTSTATDLNDHTSATHSFRGPLEHYVDLATLTADLRISVKKDSFTGPEPYVLRALTTNVGDRRTDLTHDAILEIFSTEGVGSLGGGSFTGDSDDRVWIGTGSLPIIFNWWGGFRLYESGGSNHVDLLSPSSLTGDWAITPSDTGLSLPSGKNIHGVTKTYDVSWKTPTAGDDVYVKVSDGAITITALDCVAKGGSPSSALITVKECNSNAASCATTGATASISAVDTNTQDTSFTDASIADDAWLDFEVTSGTQPSFMHCRLEYTN